MSEKKVAEPEDRVHRYRDAVAPHLAGEPPVVVGSFTKEKHPWTEGPRGDSSGKLVFNLAESLYHSMRGRYAHRLPQSFLLALTTDEAHFFEYRRTQSEIEIRDEVLMLDRDAIRFIVGKETLTLVASEGGHPTYVVLDHKSLHEQGAVEVVEALSE